MHRWETILTVRGKRYRGRFARVLICKGCGMLWTSSSRASVPICWSRYTPPHLADWWARFQALAAYHRADRLVVAQQVQDHGQDAQHGRPGRPGGQLRGLGDFQARRGLDGP